MSTLWSHVHIFSLTLSGKKQWIWFVKVNCSFAINTKDKTMAHYIDVIITAMASQITSIAVVYNRLFRRRSMKTSKLRVTDYCAGNSPGPVNSPHKGLVTREMFPFDDVTMCWRHRSFFSWSPHKLWYWLCWINRSSTMSDSSTRVTSVSTNDEDVICWGFVFLINSAR